MTTARYLVGDVFERLAEIPDSSIDLVMTSPPFYQLRSYLPDDHPDKGKEIGSEPTPDAYIDTMLALTAEWGRVLAPHGSICVELGDTYCGAGGAGGDYNPDGLRAGQPKIDGSAKRAQPEPVFPDAYIVNGWHWPTVSDAPHIVGGCPLCRSEASQPPASARRRRLHPDADGRHPDHNTVKNPIGYRYNRSDNPGPDLPPDKSLLFMPSLYAASLAYGRNLLTGQESPAGRWRVRNLVAWVRPNPPVGALGDKFRPATSYLTIACRARDRYFDLDAVRTPHLVEDHRRNVPSPKAAERGRGGDERGVFLNKGGNPAGAPPLDWWNIPPSGYPGAHYAVYPPELCTRPILTMTPQRVCTTCGLPSRRLGQNAEFGRQPELAAHIKERREALGLTSAEVNHWFGYKEIAKNWERIDPFGAAVPNAKDWPLLKERLGLSDDFDDFVMSRDRSVVEYERNGAVLDESERRPEYGRGGIGPSPTKQKARRVQIDQWSDCRHNTWRPGHVLDPFAGTGTTLAVATGHGRAATGIDLDPRNADLAQQRVGMFLTVDHGTRQETA